MRVAVSSARSPSSPVTTGGFPSTDRLQERLDLEAQCIALLIGAFLDHTCPRGISLPAGGLRTTVRIFCCRSIET